jgi:hypothetical protein
MFTEQDKVYIKDARAICNKGVMLETVIRWLAVIPTVYFLWRISVGNFGDKEFGLFFVCMFILLFMQFNRVWLGSGTKQEIKLVTFLEAKLAEAEVGTEKDSDLNADQSAEQAGQPIA